MALFWSLFVGGSFLGDRSFVMLRVLRRKQPKQVSKSFLVDFLTNEIVEFYENLAVVL